MKGALRKAVLDEAEKRRKADIDERTLAVKTATAEWNKGEGSRKYQGEAQKRLEGWQRQKPMFKYMSQHANEITSSTKYKKGLADFLKLPESAFLTNPEQVMDKMSHQVLQGISSVYPGRILASELEVYMKANPSLLNDPVALKQIAEIVLASGSMAEKEYKAIKEARKTSVDEFDLFDKVQEQLQPEYDNLNDKINKITGSEPINRSISKEKNPVTGEKLTGKMVKLVSPKGELVNYPTEIAEHAIKQGGYKYSQ